jgi:ribosomal-protein-alanine N-acetyltransferase
VNHEITSERFSLHPIGAADVTALHRLWTNEPVGRFLWDGKVVLLEQTQDIAGRNERLFQESGFGIWGIRKRNYAELVGFVGYWQFRTPPCLELVFGVAFDQWNRGMATEASKCVIRYGFNVLDFGRIEASTDVANAASVRVLEKLGMSFRRRAVLDGSDTVFYTLRRNEWWKASQRPAAERSAK